MVKIPKKILVATGGGMMLLASYYDNTFRRAKVSALF